VKVLNDAELGNMGVNHVDQRLTWTEILSIREF
jgi:hypothetical protein